MRATAERPGRVRPDERQGFVRGLLQGLRVRMAEMTGPDETAAPDFVSRVAADFDAFIDAADAYVRDGGSVVPLRYREGRLVEAWRAAVADARSRRHA